MSLKIIYCKIMLLYCGKQKYRYGVFPQLPGCDVLPTMDARRFSGSSRSQDTVLLHV